MLVMSGVSSKPTKPAKSELHAALEKVKPGRFTIEIPREIITPEGQTKIRSYLKDCVNIELPQDWDWRSVTTKADNTPFVGRFSTRVEKFCKEKGVKLLTEQKSEIGSKLERHRLQKCKIYCDFTNKFDWKPGKFGDHGSCFWGCRTLARTSLQDAGALAFRVWEDETYDIGVSRMWVVKFPDYLVCFNGYTKTNIYLPEMVKFLGCYLDLQYMDVELCNGGDCEDVIYINNGSGYLIGEKQQILKISDDSQDDAFDLCIEVSGTSCCECGEIYENDQITEVDGNNYCQSCLNEYFCECAECGEYVNNNDAYCPDYNNYCEYCYDKLYSRCDCCNEDVLRDDLREACGEDVCESCLAKHYRECDMCSETVHLDVCTTVEVTGNSQEWCESCVNKHAKECEKCNRFFPKSEVKKVEGELCCSECAGVEV